MISIIQEPGAIAFSRNPMVYGLTSDALYKTPGSNYVGLFSFTNYTDTLYTFQLLYGGLDLTFTIPIAGGADDSGYGLPSPSGLTQTQFLTAVLAALQSNSYIDRDFDLDFYNSNGNNYIRFTAKNKGAKYQLSTDIGNNHISLQQLVAGTDKTAQPNFKLLLQVWMQEPSAADYEKLSEAFIDVDDTGFATYDISRIVSDGLVAYGYDRPNLALPNSFQCVNTSRKYYLKIAEVYGTVQLVRAITQTAQKQAIYGGFSKRMREQLAFPATFIANQQTLFLDQELPVKITRIKQPEFLTWCALDFPYANINLNVDVFYTDGTVTNIRPYQHNAALYDKITFPTGYSQLNLGLLDPTKIVQKYNVNLVNAPDAQTQTVVTETKTYYMDYNYRPYGRYFLYQNGFGGYISTFTYGRCSREYNLTLQAAEITPKGGFRLIDGERLNYDLKLDGKISVSTGFMPRRAIQVYRDLMTSVDLYLMDDGRALPVSIVSKTIKEFKDGDNLYALAFDVAFNWSEEVYTFNDDEPEPYSGTSQLNFTLPVLNMPGNFDNRYYLKSQTYNKGEVDQKLAAQSTTQNSAIATVADGLRNTQAAVAGKSDVGHNHDDRYYTKAQVDAMFMAADIVLHFQAGSPSPITISALTTTYPLLGDYPSILILEKLNANQYQEFSGVRPVRSFANGHLDNISIDTLSPTGTTQTDIDIILKA